MFTQTTIEESERIRSRLPGKVRLRLGIIATQRPQRAARKDRNTQREKAKPTTWTSYPNPILKRQSSPIEILRIGKHRKHK